MRPTSLILAASLCLFTPAAHALDAAQCGAVEEQAFTVLDAEFGIEVTQSPASASQALPDGCASTELDVYVQDTGLRFRVERLVFTGANLMDWVRGAVTLPTQLRLRLDDVVLTQVPDIPQLAWLMDLVGPDQPAQIDLQWRWSEDSQQLTLDYALVDFDDNNSVNLRFAGQAFGWQPYGTPLDDLGITRLSLTASLNGLFERAVVAPLVAGGVDMSPYSMAFIAAGLQGLINAAPPSLLSAQSGVEIMSFAQTLPAPRGVLELVLTSPTPFSPPRVASELRTGVPFDRAVPQGFNVSADWTPFN